MYAPMFTCGIGGRSMEFQNPDMVRPGERPGIPRPPIYDLESWRYSQSHGSPPDRLPYGPVQWDRSVLPAHRTGAPGPALPPSGVDLSHAGHIRDDFRGLGPRNYRRSDERITEDVCDGLTEHPMVDASDLEVQVKDGEVTLKGTVADRRSKRLARDIADSVASVRDVHNEVTIGTR